MMSVSIDLTRLRRPIDIDTLNGGAGAVAPDLLLAVVAVAVLAAVASVLIRLSSSDECTPISASNSNWERLLSDKLRRRISEMVWGDRSIPPPAPTLLV